VQGQAKADLMIWCRFERTEQRSCASSSPAGICYDRTLTRPPPRDHARGSSPPQPHGGDRAGLTRAPALEVARRRRLFATQPSARPTTNDELPVLLTSARSPRRPARLCCCRSTHFSSVQEQRAQWELTRYAGLLNSLSTHRNNSRKTCPQATFPVKSAQPDWNRVVCLCYYN
jgi:hypothetical protein